MVGGHRFGRRGRAALAASALLAASAPAAARAEALSAVESAIELAARGDAAAEASFLLALADRDWPSPVPEPTCLGLLGPSGERLAVKDEWLKLEPLPQNPRVARLRARLEGSAELAPGTYLLTAAIPIPPPSEAPRAGAPGSKASKVEWHRLTLSMKLAAATLGELPKVALDPWHAFLPSGDGPVRFSLPLVETGGRAAFAPFVQLISAQGPGEAPLRASAQCPPPPERIAPGRAFDLACSAQAEGGFPVGTSKLRLLVGGTRLSNPAVLSVEVKRRRPGILILALIAAGLAAGYLVRVGLSVALRRREHLAAGWSAVAELDVQSRLYEDPDFRGKLLALRRELLDKLEAAQGDSFFGTAALEALRREVEAARAPLAAALGALEQKRADVVAQLDSARRRLAGRWILPASLSEALGEANAALAAAQGQIQQGHLDRAKGEVEKAVAAFDDRVGRAAQEYPQEIRALLEKLAPLPGDLAPHAQQGAAAVRQALASISRSGLAAAPELLAQITAANAALSDLLADLRAGMLRAIEAAAGALAGKRPEKELRLWEAKAAGALGSWPRAPWDAALAEAPAVLARFRAAMEEIQAEPRETMATAALAVNADSEGEPPHAAARARRTRPTARSFAEAVGAPSPAPTSVPPIAYPQLRVREARQSAWRLKLLQLGVLGVLATATGYSLVADRFIGTAAELAGIFGWAFAVDLSTDAVASLVKSLWKGPGAAA